MEGRGIFTFPNGTRYEGDMLDGECVASCLAFCYRSLDAVSRLRLGKISFPPRFHGYGVLSFPSGATFAADWVHGKAVGAGMAQVSPGRDTRSGRSSPTLSVSSHALSHSTLLQGQYTFADGLRFEEGGWPYCNEEDRRFYQERVNGIPPAGASLEVNAGKAHTIPEGTFDVGDGYLDLTAKQVFSYDGSNILRQAEEDECQWAVHFCRGATAEATLALRKSLPPVTITGITAGSQ